MMRIWVCFFPFLLLSFPLHSIANNVGDCNALFQFINAFTISQDAPEDYCNSISSYRKMALWMNGTDCCWWDGVTCHATTNQVIGLDLSCRGLQGPLRSNNSLFSLSHLRHLNLAGNDFMGSRISPKFAIFSGMTYLNLSHSGFSGPIHLEMIPHLSNLVTLDLSHNSLAIEERGFRWHISNFTQMRRLALDYVDMSEVPPIFLTNLSSTLMSLSLKSCNLQGTFPTDIFHLPYLQSLTLSENSALMGTLPQTNWTGPLVYLDLSNTNIHGPIPASLGNLTFMNYLDLSNGRFAGVFPSTLGCLDHLSFLYLGGNSLSGIVDFEMFSRLKNLRGLSLGRNNLAVLLQSDGNYSFPRLQIMDLSGSNLTEFPYFLRFSAELEQLNLSGNKISGQIPKWFWRVGRDTLEVLHISFNNLAGEIPFSVCELSSLANLDLSNNKLNGTIPVCLGKLNRLYSLILSQNLLQGPLPRSLANCTELNLLDVSQNGLHDNFPQWLINATSSLVHLDLQSNLFHGVIEVPLPPQFSYLRLSNNNLSGQLPVNFLLNSSIDFIDMSNNSFDGPLLPPPPTNRYYLLSNNKFRGRIPHQVCNATELYIIDMSNNRLTGTIPHCFINLAASLSVLDLRANNFSSPIPEIFSPNANYNTKFLTIRLSQNQLGGTVPQSLTHCIKLEVLDLSENELEGRFPYWLDTLPNLQVLALRSNKFYGPVDSSNRTSRPFQKLSIFDLSKNSFVGPLPTTYLANLLAMKNQENHRLEYMGEEVYKSFNYQDSIVVEIKGSEIELVKILTVFISIDFSNNFFKGEIPEMIGDLKALKGLRLSHNNLRGNIPSSMGNLTNLEWLDLSSNKLSGMIPRELADLTWLTWLTWLNLSNNQLSGPIPQSTQFDTFNHSFDKNPGLCGRPLPKACGNDVRQEQPSTSQEEEDTESSRITIEWRAVPIGYGCGLAIGISAGFIMLKARRPRWLVCMIELRKWSWKTKKNVAPGNHARRSARGHQ